MHIFQWAHKTLEKSERVGLKWQAKSWIPFKDLWWVLLPFRCSELFKSKSLDQDFLELLCLMLCWFARDVTAAMLVAKNKSNSLLYFHVNYRIDPQHGHLFTWLQSKNSFEFWVTWPGWQVKENALGGGGWAGSGSDGGGGRVAPRVLSMPVISSTSIGLKKAPTWSARMATTVMTLMMWKLMMMVVVVMTSIMIIMISITMWRWWRWWCFLWKWWWRWWYDDDDDGGGGDDDSDNDDDGNEDNDDGDDDDDDDIKNDNDYKIVNNNVGYRYSFTRSCCGTSSKLLSSRIQQSSQTRYDRKRVLWLLE